MLINSTGDVLIGNTVVNPASNFSNQKGFGYKSSTGQTEIATTSDVDTLTLGRNIAADGNILVLRKQATVVGVFGSNTAGGDPLLDIASAPGEDSLMRFLTSGSERLRIDKVGNVGIGTASPTNDGSTATTLEVRGKSGTGGGVVRVSNAGNTAAQLRTTHLQNPAEILRADVACVVHVHGPKSSNHHCI